ncbi:MAG: hypothetical protein ABI870_15465 [Rhodanobacter sp.]
MDGSRLDVFYAVDAGSWHVLMHGFDASLLGAATAGGFTGATFGPCAYLPSADSAGLHKAAGD